MIRFGILVGVSTDMQARENKASIPDQIETCRSAIEQLNGIEAGLYVMDGFSRTGYDALSDAMHDIPPLAAAVEDAQQDRYDVLMLDNWDRLGDLGQLVLTRFKKYKKQVYSARQSGRVQDPQTYDPYSDESADIDMHIQGIIQKYRLNKLRRGLQLGVKRRVEQGKYSINFPYGYLKGRDGDLELDAPVANLLIRLKDLFLPGPGTRQLEQIANASGIPASRGGTWHRSAIERLLINPFFAGKVFNGRWKMVRYTRVTPTGKRASIMKLNADTPLYDGRHQPLWTYEEHLRIVAEMEERYKLHPRRNPHNFSGLLVCSICGQRLGYKGNYYRCYPGTDHIKLKVSAANELIPEELVKALRNYSDAPPASPAIDTTTDSIAALDRQIAKVQELALKEIYNATEAKEKVDALRAEKRRIEADQQDASLRASRHTRIVSMRDRLIESGELDALPEYFHGPGIDEKKNNRFLRNILTAIHVTPEHHVTFVFR